MTEVAQATPQTETPDTSANGKSRRNTAPIQVTVPLDLKAQIEQKAEADGVPSSARWLLQLAAKELGYELPEAQARGATRPAALFPKTLSPEAKKERFDAARTLLAALDSGKIDLEAIKAQLGI